MAKNILVVLPTYNEAKTIETVISCLLTHKNLSVLVVDDNSNDGTKEKVEAMMKSNGNIYMLERPAKLGLGSAYVAGFKWGLEKKYNLFFEMDSDMSHDPNEIPSFLEKIDEGYDVVIGSRYMNDKISVVGWEFRRLMISKFGNLYSRILLNMTDLWDLTSGFRCYTREALEKIHLDSITSNGYAFQIEMTYRARKLGLRVVEIPIIFYEREFGSSKMSKSIIKEAIIMPFRVKIKEIETKLFG